MATLVLSLGVCFIAFLQLTYSEELKPFVAWSNSDALSAIKSSTSASDMVNAIASKGTKKFNLIVVFLADELSFDDIVKHGNVYSDSKAAGDFVHLKSALSSSKSQLWSGVSDSTDDISSTLASLLDLDITTFDASDIASTDVSTWRGVVTVVMDNEQSIQTQDAVLGAVEKSLKNVPHIAIYSQSDSVTKERSRRDVAESQPHLGKRAVAAASDTSRGDACSIGGVFYRNNTNSSDGDACMLFCIKNFAKQSINMTVKGGGNSSYCMLTYASSVTYCCQEDLNNATECMDEQFPFVMLTYNDLTSDNRTSTNTTNQCQPYFFSNITEDIGKGELINASAVLKFVFPHNFGVNLTEKYSNAWNMRIYPTVTYYNANKEAVHTTTANLSYARVPPNMHLFEDFEVPRGLSYACAATDYQKYGLEIVNQSANNTSPLKNKLATSNESNLSNGDIETLLLPFIQVQPYNIKSTSFSEAYNCVGYFTHASLMGVFTTLVLLLILYVSLLCSFSMNSIDRFEDPRGQTITVEKLH